MKRSSTGIGHGTDASAQCATGELSRTQRAILSGLRCDGPGTESEILQSLNSKKRGTLDELRADLHELEARHLVRCETQPNGRRIWGKA